MLNSTNPFSFKPIGSRCAWLARWIMTCLIALACFFSMPAANAQQGLGIAAIVNDDIVSVYNLESRLSLVLALSNLPNTADFRQQLAGQVLRSLIDEKLKHQEAKRLGIQVTKHDVDQALINLTKENNVQLNQLDAFLASQKIQKSALIEKLESDILWIKVVNRSLRATINIDAKSVDRLIETLKAEEGQIENLVSEIFLPVDDYAQDAQVRDTAERVVEKARSGANFNALAKIFSQSAHAAITGDLGWLKPGDLDEKLEAVVKELQPGQTSAPIRSVSGYHVLQLQKRQSAKGLPVSEITVDLQQLIFPLSPNTNEAEIKSQLDHAETMARDANTCQDMERLGKKLNSHLSGSIKDVKINAMTRAFRDVVALLEPLKVSVPIRTESEIILLMVCERQGGDFSPEQRKKVHDLAFYRRIDEAARRHLRDMRRSALVDIRL
ncbi:MAG: peptidylprolyl isomerase [Rhodospirillales bacterium]